MEQGECTEHVFTIGKYREKKEICQEKKDFFLRRN